MFSVLGPEYAVDRQRQFADALKCVQKFQDGGFAQFRISGMRHFPSRDNLVTERALRSERELDFPSARR